MKRPIDPNLSSNDDDILIGLGESRETEFSINDETKKSDNAVFKVTEKVIPSSDDRDKRSLTVDELSAKSEGNHQPLPVRETASAAPESRVSSAENLTQPSESATGASGSSHHHSSSSTHHHSSSSTHHHSSSSTHHHSSSSTHHHSSSGSHHHSSGSSHHSSSKKKLPLPARIAIAIIIILLLIILIVVGTFFVLKSMGRKDIVTPTVQEAEYQEVIEYNGHTYHFNENIVSLGFVGIDKRDMETVDETDFVGAGDTDIVIAIDTNTGETKAIAIPRDTMVDINITTPSGVYIRTQEAQLCLAYAYGDGAEESCKNSISAMSRILLNVPIEKYFVLDMDGIAPLNDAIGGVTVTSLYDFKDQGISVGDTVTLRGSMAETYVRIRDMDRIDASLNRVERQVQYVKAYAQQALPAVVRDFGTISDLYNTASDYSQTNLTLGNATYLGSLLLSKGITDFESYTLQGEMKASADAVLPDVVHAEFYPDEDNLMQTVLDVFYTQLD